MKALVKSMLATLPDELADALLVEYASQAMRAKLQKKRAEGRGGWHTPKASTLDLQHSLAEHVRKGDSVDVMNLAAMLHLRREIYDEAEGSAQAKTEQPSDIRFATLPSGIIFDRTHNLQWAPTLSKSLTHAEAIQAAAACRAGGFDDWRLPTIDELETLRDRSRAKPATHTPFIADTKSECYWSSSPVASNPDCAWIVNFNYGHSSLDHRGYRYWVRPVRASQ